MANLYTDLSEVYEMMYQTFINYDEEYTYYSTKLKKHNSRSVIELGCGTGHLAGRFIAGGFDYTGFDVNDAMLEIAKSKHSAAVFKKEDMRDFKLDTSKDACLLAGRTSAYLITNKDVLDCFRSIYNSLNEAGILLFDVIDATEFIQQIKNGKKITHRAIFNKRKFRRESYWSVNEAQSWTFNWDSVYFEEDEKGNSKELGKDNSVIRAFTKDEISLMLKLSGFNILEIENRSSYAFDTFVVVAQKIIDYGNV
ncbi:MAG TPA: class I SAM-dependent methyltransferase [Chitinophagaceae bacterium]